MKSRQERKALRQIKTKEICTLNIRCQRVISKLDCDSFLKTGDIILKTMEHKRKQFQGKIKSREEEIKFSEELRQMHFQVYKYYIKIETIKDLYKGINKTKSVRIKNKYIKKLKKEIGYENN